MSKTLLDKIWEMHTVRELESGETQLFIGLHLIHEVTSPQAFQMLRERDLKVLYPNRTFATIDHIIPTDNRERPFADPLAEEMTVALEKNTKDYGIELFASEQQGIVHVIAPEQGLVQPGMTIVCGDSHTSTHGAFGVVSFGIGTSQVRDVLATQTLAISKPKLRRIKIEGKLGKGVSAKDVALRIINELGVNGGTGYVYEFAGSTIENMCMEGRMTVCNMSIEGGARIGYINPDQTTFDYIEGRKHVPKGTDFEKAVEFWRSIASDHDVRYDDEVEIVAESIEPIVTWGINPGQSVIVSKNLPGFADLQEAEQEPAKLAFEYMNFGPDQQMAGKKIDVAFIGSCTNGRYSDLEAAAEVLRGRKVAPHVKAIVVPGSHEVKQRALDSNLNKIFTDAGFEWREPGCSMCLAMNPDKLSGDQLCASSSNRNFIGRQGSPTGRTLLMSPAMVAAAAVKGEVADVRQF